MEGAIVISSNHSPWSRVLRHSQKSIRVWADLDQCMQPGFLVFVIYMDTINPLKEFYGSDFLVGRSLWDAPSKARQVWAAT